MFSNIALKIYTAKILGLIKSNTDFWDNFTFEKVSKLNLNTKENEDFLNGNNISLICAYDEEFPNVIGNIKKNDKPYLLIYKGNIKLLKEYDNNISVIGVLKPTPEIIFREEKIVKQFINANKNIVSGLALGCDTVAHKVATDNNKKTIAILPSTFQNIYPKVNKGLTEAIINANGLIITEYISEPKDKYEIINRFIERDRLQSMFSKNIVLIASYRHGEGDSGSRHAMKKSKEYSFRNRFIMYNNKLDKGLKIMGLNEDLSQEDGIKIITENSIKDLLV